MAGETVDASPEEQAQYETVVDNALKAIYSEKGLPQILDRIKKSVEAGDPQEGIAAVAAMVVMRIEESAKQAGKPIADDVLFHAGVEIVEDLADLASENQIHDFSQEEIDGALYRSLDLYRETKGKKGQIDQGAADQQFTQLLEASKAGGLDQFAPGGPQQKGAA
tara:strand:- start:219 stop:713 length:495 start_codon:yes stop_codon:yes gene_type:complete